MRVSDDKVGTGSRSPERQKIARVILAPGGNVNALRVQEVRDLSVDTDYRAEGRRLAEFFYWGVPWRYFNGLQERLNELMPPDTDRYGRKMTH